MGTAATSKCDEYQWRERSMFDLDNSLVVSFSFALKILEMLWFLYVEA
jgi:hypothetical protein